ncbi:sugar ABC transporter substrate-binding protein [Sinanaerobacter chloroacetimidivorans]|uniref:Sugar ABC transporter substrate-binding protein n=1 Tax=Sinanaerobacter chloroacetimidivorans TaxID=2818044 RepID=A0A8J8B322_9FIRM|nr:sugar ABC transporter substrate-binding protein [Sinanaerobacter chloroacetimidivorans]MBR0597865.1 sugar ABC transporter substrate-binding protein [Sinanaerobacter chloroacetimidivorans]
MKKKQILALFLVVVMAAGLFIGCGGNTPEGSAESSGDAAAETDYAKELYSMMPDTCLSGVFDPNALEDRTNINKALPFKPKDPKNVVIGWTEITQSDPWFVSVGDAAKERCAEYGYTLNFDVADGDLQKQSAHIDSYIARGVDIIVVDPTDVVGIAADIQRAVDAGIPVIGFGSEIYGAPVITTITANTFEDGYAVGKYTATQYGADEQINLGIVIGMMGNSTAESRVNGLLSGLVYGRAQAMGKEITREQAIVDATKLFKSVVKSGKFDSNEYKIACLNWGEGGWTYEGGLAVGETMLSAVGDQLNLIIGENDFQGAGAYKAVENYGLTDKIKIACIGNGMKAEVTMVKNGQLLATSTHSGQHFAYSTIDMIHDLVEGTNTYNENNLPMLTAFDSFAIKKENVDQVWDPDPKNLYHKVPALQIRTVSELKKAIENGTYYAAD